MTRVLLVYHDTNVADIEADELRRAGYEVDRCAGPVGGGPCPVLRGQPCWQVEAADVLLYDRWDPTRRGPDLVGKLRDLHGDKPLVVTSSSGHHVANAHADESIDPVVAPTRASLQDAIERALRAPHASAAEVRDARREVGAYHGPTW
jgi:DNA-binding NtrC family response regulator